MQKKKKKENPDKYNEFLIPYKKNCCSQLM